MFRQKFSDRLRRPLILLPLLLALNSPICNSPKSGKKSYSTSSPASDLVPVFGTEEEEVEVLGHDALK